MDFEGTFPREKKRTNPHQTHELLNTQNPIQMRITFHTRISSRILIYIFIQLIIFILIPIDGTVCDISLSVDKSLGRKISIPYSLHSFHWQSDGITLMHLFITKVIVIGIICRFMNAIRFYKLLNIQKPSILATTHQHH